MSSDAGDTATKQYAERMVAFERGSSRWKYELIWAPKRRAMRRYLRGRRGIDLGAGTGRLLDLMGPGSIGIDHNEDLVAVMHTRGFAAETPTEFLKTDGQRYDALLTSHVLEHLDPGTQADFLQPYVDRLTPGAVVMVLCPQEAGFASDATHTDFMDFTKLKQVLTTVGLIVQRAWSFPFPRFAGKFFRHNDFFVVATKP